MFSSSFPAELSQQFQFGAIITSVLARLQNVADGSVNGVSEAVSKVGVHVCDCVCVSSLISHSPLVCSSPHHSFFFP